MTIFCPDMTLPHLNIDGTSLKPGTVAYTQPGGVRRPKSPPRPSLEIFQSRPLGSSECSPYQISARHTRIAKITFARQLCAGRTPGLSYALSAWPPCVAGVDHC